jgi:hypothetical protein
MVGCLSIGLGMPTAISTAMAAPAVGRLDNPSAVTVADKHLWIANRAGNSVTEADLSGRWVRTLSAARYAFAQPDALGRVGSLLFVVNRGGSVTEINASDGGLIRVIRGARYRFDRPVAIATNGHNVWVTNSTGRSVTEFAARSGALIRVLRNPARSTRFDDPVAITVANGGVWVVNAKGGSTTDANAGSLTEIDPTTGAVLRRVHGPRFGLERPAGIAFEGSHLWISDSLTNAVTETTDHGQLVQVINNASHNANYGFDGPNAVGAFGGLIYVISPLSSSPMITQIDPTTAEGDWYECNTNSPTPGWLNPTGLAVQGGHVWVVGGAVGGGSVLVELTASKSGPHAGQVIKRFT